MYSSYRRQGLVADSFGRSNKPSVFIKKERFWLAEKLFSFQEGVTESYAGTIIWVLKLFLGLWDRVSPSYRCLQSFEWSTVCSRRKPGGVTSWQPEPRSATSDGRPVAPVPDSRGLQMSSHKQDDLIISPVVPLAEPTSHDVMVPTRISWCCVLSGINFFISSVILTSLRRCATWECVLQASEVWITVVDSEWLF